MCEAFSTPSAFIDDDTLANGSNELNKLELMLIDEYTKLDRPDLARCVTEGKPFFWATMLFATDAPWRLWPRIRALGEALGIVMEQNLHEFLVAQRVKYASELKPLGQ